MLSRVSASLLAPSHLSPRAAAQPPTGYYRYRHPQTPRGGQWTTWRCLALFGARLIRPRSTQQMQEKERGKNGKHQTITKSSKIPRYSKLWLMTSPWPHCAWKSVPKAKARLQPEVTSYLTPSLLNDRSTLKSQLSNWDSDPWSSSVSWWSMQLIWGLVSLGALWGLLNLLSPFNCLWLFVTLRVFQESQGSQPWHDVTRCDTRASHRSASHRA